MSSAPISSSSFSQATPTPYSSPCAIGAKEKAVFASESVDAFQLPPSSAFAVSFVPAAPRKDRTRRRISHMPASARTPAFRKLHFYLHAQSDQESESESD